MEERHGHHEASEEYEDANRYKEVREDRLVPAGHIKH
jgi:hypothetical protein